MGAVVTVSVPGTIAGVTQAVEAFEQFTAVHQLTEPVRWRFLVALDEILSNIVRHGFRGSPGTIDLAFHQQDRTTTVEVADHAAPFNPLAMSAPDTTTPLEERTAGGLGVMFVQSLMDDVR